MDHHPTTSLVSIKHIPPFPAQLAIRNLQPNPQCPRRRNTRRRKRRIAAHGNHILRPIGRRIQVRRVDETSHRDDIHDRQRNRLLLRRLAQGSRHPAEDHRVDGIHAGREEEARDVARGDVERSRADDEADHRDAHHHGNVPCAVVVLPRRNTNQNADCAGDEGRGRSQHEGNGRVEAEGFDDRGEELVERCGAQVHVLHEYKQVEARVAQRLHEAGLCALALGEADGVALDAVVGELALLGGEPAGGEGRVGEDEDADDCDADCDDA